MIPKSKLERVREHDEQGRLKAAGFLWTDDRSNAKEWFEASMTVATLLGIFGAAASDRHTIGWMLAPALVLGVVSCVIASIFGYRARGVIFYDDGRIVKESGVPGYARRYLIVGHWNMISSIEYQIESAQYPVYLYFNVGSCICLGVSLQSDEARIAVVHLVQALQEMRDHETRPAPSFALID